MPFLDDLVVRLWWEESAVAVAAGWSLLEGLRGRESARSLETAGSGVYVVVVGGWVYLRCSCFWVVAMMDAR